MKRVLPILVTALLFAGCLPSPSCRSVCQSWQTENIETEIEKRKTLSEKRPEDPLLLAILYAHPYNRKPDYRAAQQYLDNYLANLPANHRDPLALYILNLLDKINATDEVITGLKNQLEGEKTKRVAHGAQHEDCLKKLATARSALKRSKKTSKQTRAKLEKAKITINRLQAENRELKKQIEDLTNLYINLEKKRRAIQ